MNFSDVDLTLYGGHDPRLQPIYPVAGAARLAGVAPSTLRSWTMGREYPTQNGPRSFAPVIEPPADKFRRLSFVNVIEAHVLSSLRSEHQMRLDAIRAAISFVQRELQIAHPLAEQVFRTDGIHLFVEHFGGIVNASSGQTSMFSWMEAHLSRVEYDNGTLSTRLFPFVSRPRDESSLEAMRAAPRSVVVNPFVAFGRPVLAGHGITAAAVIDRFDAGESVSAIAYDLDCEPILIEDALRYAHLAA